MNESEIYKHTLVCGSGYSVAELQNLNNDYLDNHTIIAFQQCFPHIITMYGIMPHTWTWYDPDSAMKGLRFLLDVKNKKLFDNRKLNIIIPKFATLTYKNGGYRNCVGTSPVWRNKSLYQEYYSSIELLSNKHFVNIFEMDCYTSKELALHKEVQDICGNLLDNPEKRFSLDKPFFGSFPYSSDNHLDGYWGQENKLTCYVLPFCYHIKCNTVDLLGFDYGGNRFYDLNTRHPFPKFTEGTEHPIYRITYTWIKEWYKYHKIKINSLATKNNTLTKIIDYFENK